MAITGTHLLLYTTEPEKLRAVFRDVFKWHHVDAGHSWLIFRAPPAELAVHPAEAQASGIGHQITFMCDDIHATVKELGARGLTVQGDPTDRGWGITVMLALPGGVQVMLYQPKHPVALP